MWGVSGEAGRQTQVWGGIRPLLSFVTQTVSQAAEVKWDTAVGESKVTLTALVNSFLCDFVCDLCGWVVCVKRAKQQETLCCHLSVRGDSGRSCWLVHWRQASARFVDTKGCLFMYSHGQTQSTAQYFRKVNIRPPGIADTSCSLSPAASSFSLKLHLQMETSLGKSFLALLAVHRRWIYTFRLKRLKNHQWGNLSQKRSAISIRICCNLVTPVFSRSPHCWLLLDDGLTTKFQVQACVTVVSSS